MSQSMSQTPRGSKQLGEDAEGRAAPLLLLVGPGRRGKRWRREVAGREAAARAWGDADGRAPGVACARAACGV